MGKRAYVGNIPFDTNEQEIRDFFKSYQLTSVKLVTDRDTGRSRGFAFVDFESEADLQDAINEYDGRELGGRKILVNEAMRKEQSQQRSARGRR